MFLVYSLGMPCPPRTTERARNCLGFITFTHQRQFRSEPSMCRGLCLPGAHVSSKSGLLSAPKRDGINGPIPDLHPAPQFGRSPWKLGGTLLGICNAPTSTPTKPSRVMQLRNLPLRGEAVILPRSNRGPFHGAQRSWGGGSLEGTTPAPGATPPLSCALRSLALP